MRTKVQQNALKCDQIEANLPAKKANVFPMREMEEHAFDLSKRGCEAVKLQRCKAVIRGKCQKEPSLKNCPLGPSVAGFCL